jgi:8-oxo-dGTP diphosphatase
MLAASAPSRPRALLVRALTAAAARITPGLAVGTGPRTARVAGPVQARTPPPHLSRATAAAATSTDHPAMKKTVLVAAAALLDDRGRVLLAQRPAGKSMAGLWEFPGGKVDPGESLEAALARELAEELGVAVDPAGMTPLTFASHSYETFYLVMPLYLVTAWTGTPAGKEGQALEWVPAGRLGSKPMPPADAPLLAAVERAARDRAVPAVADAT